MSFQPIYTSAFSSFPVGGRAFYADRAQGTQKGDQSEKNAAADIGQVGATPGTEQTQTVQSVSKSERSEYDPDAGKPKSASGDVLELSDKAQQLASKTDESKAATTAETSETHRNTEAAELKSDERKSDDSKSDERKSDERRSEEKSAEERKIKLQDDAKAEKKAEVESDSSLNSESELSPEEEDQLSRLKARDTEVRQHEAAHLAAAGQYATSGASYTYQKGPDGNNYAIGGEVSISTGSISGDPEATLAKAQIIQRAALAPAEPSSQDQKVAAEASQMAAQARAEIAQRNSEAASGTQEEGNQSQGLQSTTDSQAAKSSSGAADSKSAAGNSNSIGGAENSSAFKLGTARAAANSPASNYAAQSSMSSGGRSVSFAAYA